MQIIKDQENFKPVAYWDKTGKRWTGGFGTTIYPDGSRVQEGDTFTEEKAEAYMNDAISKIKLPDRSFSVNQKEALLCLIYNVGQDAFDTSKLRKAIIKKDIKNIFKEWDYISSGGEVLRGLILRRLEEQKLFFSDRLDY